MKNTIWHKQYALSELLTLNINMSQHMGVEFTEITPSSLSARMPITNLTRQPMGLLHGGASGALAETIGSVASNLVIDPKIQVALGQSLYVQHLRSASEGTVTGIATPIRLGSRTHIWSVEISHPERGPIALAQLTTAILPRQGRQAP